MSGVHWSQTWSHNDRKRPRDSVPGAFYLVAGVGFDLRPLGYERRDQRLPSSATSPQYWPGSAKTGAAVSIRLTRSNPTQRDPFTDPFTTVDDR